MSSHETKLLAKLFIAVIAYLASLAGILGAAYAMVHYASGVRSSAVVVEQKVDGHYEEMVVLRNEVQVLRRSQIGHLKAEFSGAIGVKDAHSRAGGPQQISFFLSIPSGASASIPPPIVELIEWSRHIGDIRSVRRELLTVSGTIGYAIHVASDDPAFHAGANHRIAFDILWPTYIVELEAGGRSGLRVLRYLTADEATSLNATEGWVFADDYK